MSLTYFIRCADESERVFRINNNNNNNIDRIGLAKLKYYNIILYTVRIAFEGRTRSDVFTELQRGGELIICKVTFLIFNNATEYYIIYYLQ